MNRAPLRRISARRLEETWLYQYRRKEFLAAHPYCQAWVAEHGLIEAEVIRQHGRIQIDGTLTSAPLATEIHHTNKRRSNDLLDTRFWLAVSADAHRRIEMNKAWARAQGYLLDF